MRPPDRPDLVADGVGAQQPTSPAPEIAGIVLVHGAGSGPWVFDGWKKALSEIAVSVPDLHEGLDVAIASMSDYATAVVQAFQALPPPVVVCGWSMGGLVAMMAAHLATPNALVLIEPSPPGEVQGFEPSVDLIKGTFDPEAVYGPFPPGITARVESQFARSERARGISVPTLPCPSLVMYGDQFPDTRGWAIARRYGGREHAMPGLDHWGLVLDPRVPQVVRAYVLGR